MDAKSGPSIHLECVSLAEALFCAECEMISNSRSYCLCCGSSAVIPVARLLGGSLSQDQRAALVDAQPAMLSYAVPASDAGAPQRRKPVAALTNGEAAA